MVPRRLRPTAFLLFTLGCGGDPQPATPTSAAGDTDGSWMLSVARDPGLLKPLEQMGAGDGWLAIFHNDLKGAVKLLSAECKDPKAPWEDQKLAGFPCVGLARAHLELAETYAAAAEVERVALRQFYQHRATHQGEVLPSSQEDYFTGVVLLASGDQAGGLAALERYGKSAAVDPLLGALAARILASTGGGDPLVSALWLGGTVEVPTDATFATLPDSETTRTYKARLAFAAAATRGDVGAATEALRHAEAEGADLLETLSAPDKPLAVTLYHHDPMLLRARAWLHAHHALAASSAEGPFAILHALAQKQLRREPVAATAPGLTQGLPLVVFSEFPHPADLVALLQPDGADHTRKRLAARHAELGLDATSDLSDLDPFVGGSNAAKEALEADIRAASPEGAMLNMDLGLAERLRSHLLRSRAAEMRRRFQVRMEADLGADAASAGVAARSLLELVMDKDPSPPNPVLKRARISFRNDPPALVELARANLDTRRPYDANEYVRPLTEAFPELVPVRESLTALDSAWNPARQGSVR